MGIQDREYYRGDSHGPGFFSGYASACKTIIAINVAAYVLYQAVGGQQPGDDMLAASSSDIFRHGRVWELLTATFLHANFRHIFGNMLFLWFAGSEVEARYGKRDFVAFYLSAAVVSTLGWAIVDATTGGGGGNTMIGASGAVMAVVVLFALHDPRREVQLFFFLPIQIWLVVVLYIAYDAFQLFQDDRQTHVAFASHLTGAAFGYLFKRFDLRWSRLPWAAARRPRLRLITPEPREKPKARPAGPTWSPNPAGSPKPTTTAVLPEEQLDEKLDEVLAKIAREGRSGLTEEENRVLLEASRRARNRRSDRI